MADHPAQDADKEAQDEHKDVIRLAPPGQGRFRPPAAIRIAPRTRVGVVLARRTMQALRVRPSTLLGKDHSKMRILLASIAACIVAGCAQTGYQRAERTVQSMDSTRAELVAGREQVASTVSVLDQIFTAGAGDLRPLHQQLGRQIRTLENQANLARRRADAYRANADAYISAWADELVQIRNPAIRQVSEQRRREAMANFGAVEQGAAAVREAYRPFLDDLQGIHALLGQDLTAGGVAAASGQFDQAKQDAQVLQQRIAQLINELDRVASALIPSTAG